MKPPAGSVDPDIARKIACGETSRSAHFACAGNDGGPHDAICDLLTGVVERLLKDRYLIPPAAIHWLRAGERGISSETIFARMTGVPVGQSTWAPSDPADLRRCRLLLEAVPSFAARIQEMADVGRGWGLLVPHWDRLCALMDEEAPDWRNGVGEAPKTFALMNELLGMTSGRREVPL